MNKTSRTHIGSLMRGFSGGGHEAAGTCQVPHEDAEEVLREIVSAMNHDELALPDEAWGLVKAA